MDTVAHFVSINTFCQNLPDAMGQRPMLPTPYRMRRRLGRRDISEVMSILAIVASNIFTFSTSAATCGASFQNWSATIALLNSCSGRCWRWVFTCAHAVGVVWEYPSWIPLNWWLAITYASDCTGSCGGWPGVGKPPRAGSTA